MFKIKICGITTPEDALLAADAGADAIGLNFYEKSPRFVSSEQLEKILAALKKCKWKGMLGGVYVGGVSLEHFRLIAAPRTAMGATSFVQLHGDESPDYVAWIRETFDKTEQISPKKFPSQLRWVMDAILPARQRLIRAARCNISLDEIEEYLQECSEFGGLPHAVLLDAHAPGAYGGTGQTIDWNMIREQRNKLLGLPMILAGGLTPDNVAQAILTAHPDAVDVASGVESSPGKKDSAKVRDFVAAAKEAFSTLARSPSEG